MQIFSPEIVESFYKLPFIFLFSFLGGFLVSLSIQILVSGRIALALLCGLAGVATIYISYGYFPSDLVPYLKWLHLIFAFAGFFRVNIFAEQRHRY
jgi:CHASE2 domain-containing sensor protein